MKKYLVFTLILSLLFSIGANLLKSERVRAEVGTDIGKKAPAFTIPNISGNDRNLRNYQGQKVFLNFWATWCPPCKKEMPAIQKYYEEIQDNNEIAVLAVNVKEPKGKVLDYLMKKSFNFPILLDKNGKTAQKYAVRGIPTTYIIDKQGIIVEKHVGILSYENIKSLMKKAEK